MLHINSHEPPIDTEDIMNYLYFLILILRWDLHVCVNVLEKFVLFTPSLFSISRYSSHENSSLAFYAIHFVPIKFCVLHFSPLTLSPTFNGYLQRGLQGVGCGCWLERRRNKHPHALINIRRYHTHTYTLCFISEEILKKILLHSNIHRNENGTSDDNTEEVTMIWLKGFIGGDDLFGFPGNPKKLTYVRRKFLIGIIDVNLCLKHIMRGPFIPSSLRWSKHQTESEKHERETRQRKRKMKRKNQIRITNVMWRYVRNVSVTQMNKSLLNLGWQQQKFFNKNFTHISKKQENQKQHLFMSSDLFSMSLVHKACDYWWSLIKALPNHPLVAESYRPQLKYWLEYR